MSSHTHSRDHGHHGHDHAHGHVHHGHAHAPTTPHPPMALPPSFMRLSLGIRLGVVSMASAALWAAVWLAMR
jgi:hypothetical protein